MIIDGQKQSLLVRDRPPLVNGRIVLPKFAQAQAFFAIRTRRNQRAFRAVIAPFCSGCSVSIVPRKSPFCNEIFPARTSHANPSQLPEAIPPPPSLTGQDGTNNR